MAKERASYLLRLEPDLMEKVRAVADRAEVSVNQLLQGIVRWGMAHGHVGEAERDKGGYVRGKKQAGCVWFGSTGEEKRPQDCSDDPDWTPRKGEVVFTLDFTARRVVREED